MIFFYTAVATLPLRCIGRSSSDKKYQVEYDTFSLGKSIIIGINFHMVDSKHANYVNNYVEKKL